MVICGIPFTHCSECIFTFLLANFLRNVLVLDIVDCCYKVVYITVISTALSFLRVVLPNNVKLAANTSEIIIGQYASF